MAKILFDLVATQPAGPSKFHGGGEYAKTVFYEILKCKNSKDIIDVFWNYSVEIDDKIKNACKKYELKTYNCSLDNQVNELLKENRYDVFYSALPYIYGKLEVPSKTKFIYTVHGLRCMEMPTDMIKHAYSSNKIKGALKCILEKVSSKYRLKEYTTQERNISHLMNCTKNQMIITDSEHSKYSILNFFPYLKSEDIRVFYAPAKEQNNASLNISVEKFSLVQEKYILMVSGNRWEKNALRGAEAMDSLFNSHENVLPKELKVVITGVSDKNVFWRKIKHRDRFLLLDYVESSDLDALYQHAHILLYPSLNEGFGYPPIEAMEYGTLCCCSAIASIPEICRDAVIYFNPFDINEIKNRVLQSFDKEIENEYKQRITKQKEKIATKQKEDLNQLAQSILARN